MTKDHSNENHLSKDELLQILNEIDSEQYFERKLKKDYSHEVEIPPNYPSPSNPFF